jgi:hypothetical protein
MILAPTLTLNTLARGYDADATAFAAASGATDVAALSAFVKGVKELGLWSNMVCWPLRSTQNAGTGTTAYSLGGLGTFNGTLTNGPTWENGGISFTRASSQRITLGAAQILPASSGYSAIVVAQHINTAQEYHMALTTGAGRGCEIYPRSNGSTNLISAVYNSAGSAVGPESSAYSTLNPFLAVTSADATGYSAYWNGTEYGSGAGNYSLNAGSSNLETIGAYVSGGTYQFHFNGTISFAGLASARVTSDQRTTLRNLYKDTLGTGLGLP